VLTNFVSAYIFERPSPFLSLSSLIDPWSEISSLLPSVAFLELSHFFFYLQSISVAFSYRSSFAFVTPLVGLLVCH